MAVTWLSPAIDKLEEAELLLQETLQMGAMQMGEEAKGKIVTVLRNVAYARGVVAAGELLVEDVKDEE